MTNVCRNTSAKPTKNAQPIYQERVLSTVTWERKYYFWSPYLARSTCTFLSTSTSPFIFLTLRASHPSISFLLVPLLVSFRYSKPKLPSFFQTNFLKFVIYTFRYATSILMERISTGSFDSFYSAGRRGRLGEDCQAVYLECNEI